MYGQFIRIGRDMFLSGLVSSHSGNMSVRQGDSIFITRRGSMLGRLRPSDIIETGLHRDTSGIMLASSEIGVHRAIYSATSALAVVHAHPPRAIALSLARSEIIPLDSEGSYLLHKVPVVSVEHTVGSREMQEAIPRALQRYKVVMLRGHGSFAIGQFLEEAYQLTSALEASCQVLMLAEGTGQEYRRYAGKYKEW